MTTRASSSVGGQVIEVSVEAPPRLHLGFFDLNGGLGRKFGSLGLTLDGLYTQISGHVANATSCVGPQSDRALALVSRTCELLDISGGFALEIHGAIPSHAGLGSGTQLALAVGTIVARLAGVEVSAREIAHLLDRGARSGIGVGGFEQGGFIVDGGRGPSDAPPPTISRLPFPTAWRVILILDHACQGLHGKAESAAFKELPPFPEAQAERLCREVLMRALPALAEADLNTFGAAITDLQNTIGDYFAPAQGGRYTSARVAAVLAQLARSGVACLGQSSWGPTGFAVVESESQARAWVETLGRQYPDAGLEFMVCAARNRGGEIRVRSRQSSAADSLPSHAERLHNS